MSILFGGQNKRTNKQTHFVIWRYAVYCITFGLLEDVDHINPSPAEPGYTLPLQTV